MTSAVNGPLSANSLAIQRSKSVACFASEIDTRRLRHVMLEQHPERLRVRLVVPFLETRQRIADVGRGFIFFRGREPRERRPRDWRELRDHGGPRLGVA